MFTKTPVWLLIHLHTVNATSTHHFILPDLSIGLINGRPMLPCMYFINLSISLWTSTSGSLNIAHKNKTTNCMSGTSHFERYNICSKKLWKRSASVQESLVASSERSKMWCEAGVSDSPLMYYDFSSRIFPMYFTIYNFTFHWWGVVYGLTELLVDITLCYVHYFNIPILFVNYIKKAINNLGINMRHV